MTTEKWLLDTNVLLIALISPGRLPADARALLQNRRNTVYFSAVSIWEIAIKRSLGRDDFDFEPQDIHRLAIETGFTELPVKSRDCYPIARMAWHHRDPFDRLLVAQAQSLPAFLLTTDTILQRYSELVHVVH
uniref:PIN domain nuclease, a component of toxin-antitoxin system (PIN domain) n=1 Tax=Candidatus Kentrum sp. DK TaxID=2126562 RepID=A0A450S124_9GAMM|nr:MAG: PIN domain nuclease, a component of toxin-antitoxin system (PIN domain) [Candidatus Kentron sp. DK]VFJ61849.1 MAG: PIN domain nuclease, a component of toxin-antitoxin system (PIN domain) [Candidatus Kentron sp. DK]